MENLEDKVQGMFAAQFLGDALGAPHEFYKWNRNTVYTGRLEIEPYRKGGSRYAPKDIVQPVGSVTDDTQMTIALLRVLLENDFEYNQESAIVEYTIWAHSGALDMGRNTRYLFKSTASTTAKILRGYELRVQARDKEISQGTMQVSLSNGALMRASPLALLSNWEEATTEDVNITNPYPETITVSLIYVAVLREALLGATILELIEFARSEVEVRTSSKNELKRVRYACKLALKNKYDLEIGGKDKGLAIYGLYCALRSLVLLVEGYGYASIIHWVITQGTNVGQGDTDTNASIAGALLGATLGYDKLMEDKITESNWSVLMETADRVEGELSRYVPNHFYTLCSEYTRLARRVPRE